MCVFLNFLLIRFSKLMWTYFLYSDNKRAVAVGAVPGINVHQVFFFLLLLLLFFQKIHEICFSYKILAGSGQLLCDSSQSCTPLT